MMGRSLTWSRVAVAVLAVFALSACLITPGRFAATMDLRRDGSFGFTYKGEIYLMALSKLAQMADDAEAANAEFSASDCYDDELDPRDCSADELAEQRSNWEQEQVRKRENSKKERETMQAMFGGIDPADPKAAEEVAERLRRQEGWRSVTYKGDGLYEVDFAIASRASHDFAFPSIEGFPLTNPFVLATMRQGRKVRVTAPGFAAQGGNNPLAGMMGGMAGALGGMTPTEKDDLPSSMPPMEGTFRLTTDGAILANNTEEGPVAGTTGQMLEWTINRRTEAAPMALIDLSRN